MQHVGDIVMHACMRCWVEAVSSVTECFLQDFHLKSPAIHSASTWGARVAGAKKQKAVPSVTPTDLAYIWRRAFFVQSQIPVYRYPVLRVVEPHLVIKRMPRLRYPVLCVPTTAIRLATDEPGL